MANWIIWAAAPFVLYFERQLVFTVRDFSGGNELSTSLGILGLAGLIFSAASSYLVYLLVNRRNNHLAREEALLWETFQNLKAKTLQTDMKALMPLSSAEQSLARFSEDIKERSAVLWALLILIPYVGWISMIYVLAFLSRDFENHERGEDLVLEDLGRAMSAQRATQALPRRIRRGGRNTPAYVVLSILTVGIFLFGWLYLTVEDPDPHFQYHRYFEDVLVPALLEGTVRTGTGVA